MRSRYQACVAWEVAVFVLGWPLRVQSYATEYSLLPLPESLCLSASMDTDTSCIVDDPDTSSCEITRVGKYSCYVTHNCRGGIVGYEVFESNFNITNSTEIYFGNITEPSLTILLILKDKDYWLLKANNSKGVRVLGVPEDTALEARYFFSQNCTGCPPPIIYWYPTPKYHQIMFMVPPNQDPDLGTKLEIIVFSSNITGFSDDVSCLYGDMSTSEVTTVNGSVNEKLGIMGLFSTEFCIRVLFTSPLINDYFPYTCGRRFNMTELPNHPVHFDVETPSWWIVGLVALNLLLGTAIITPFAIHKGWLKYPYQIFVARRTSTNLSASTSTCTTTCTANSVNPDGNKSYFAADESTCFLTDAPNVEKPAYSTLQTRRCSKESP